MFNSIPPHKPPLQAFQSNTENTKEAGFVSLRERALRTKVGDETAFHLVLKEALLLA